MQQIKPAWNTAGKLGRPHTVHPSRRGWAVNGFGQERRWAARLENETARQAVVDTHDLDFVLPPGTGAAVMNTELMH